MIKSLEDFEAELIKVKEPIEERRIEQFEPTTLESLREDIFKLEVSTRGFQISGMDEFRRLQGGQGIDKQSMTLNQHIR